mmetsp:Transcript_11462/g.30876  ORF Transcript_11462/g.30876 Transcript_11462/m.30876 type:complete len:195 (+) Transcript_11462:424-1008(+)
MCGSGDGGADGRDGEFVCAICLDVIDDGDSVKRLPCDHMFHSKCASRWICRANRCPLCNMAVKKVHSDPKTTSAGTADELEAAARENDSTAIHPEQGGLEVVDERGVLHVVRFDGSADSTARTIPAVDVEPRAEHNVERRQLNSRSLRNEADNEIRAVTAVNAHFIPDIPTDDAWQPARRASESSAVREVVLIL